MKFAEGHISLGHFWYTTFCPPLPPQHRDNTPSSGHRPPSQRPSTRYSFPHTMSDIDRWVEAQGLSKYRELLATGGIETLDSVLALTEPELRDMGFRKVGARKKLLRAIQEEVDLRACNGGRGSPVSRNVVGRSGAAPAPAPAPTPGDGDGDLRKSLSTGAIDDGAAVQSRNVGKTSGARDVEERREAPGFEAPGAGAPAPATDSDDASDGSPGPSLKSCSSFQLSLRISSIDLDADLQSPALREHAAGGDLGARPPRAKASRLPQLEEPYGDPDAPPADEGVAHPLLSLTGLPPFGGSLSPQIPRLDTAQRPSLPHGKAAQYLASFADDVLSPSSARSTASRSSSLAADHIDEVSDLLDKWDSMSPTMSPLTSARPRSSFGSARPRSSVGGKATVPPLERMKRAVARHCKVSQAQRRLLEVTGKGRSSLQQVNQECNELRDEQAHLDFVKVVREVMMRSPLANCHGTELRKRSFLVPSVATPVLDAAGASPRRSTYSSSMAMQGKPLPPLAPVQRKPSLVPALAPHFTGKVSYAQLLRAQDLQQQEVAERAKQYNTTLENMLGAQESAWARLEALAGR